MPTTDEAVDPVAESPRRGLPSASSFPRYNTCLASLPWEEFLRNIGELPKDYGSDVSRRGDRIHDLLKCFALKEVITEENYKNEEIATAKRLWGMVENLIIRTFGTRRDGFEIIVEERLWFSDYLGRLASSGQFDIIILDHRTKSALVVDYKSGWKEVDEAKENWQLKFAVVMVGEVWDIKNVTAAIAHAKDGLDYATFNESEYEDALEGIDETLARKHMNPFELGFTRSEKCQYCPALKCCPAVGMDMKKLMELTPMLMASASGREVSEYGIQMEGVKYLFPVWENEVKYRLQRNMPVPGWTLESGASRRNVINAKGMADELIGLGVAVGDVMDVIKIPIGEAEQLYMVATGETGRQAKKNFNELMEPYFERSNPEPSLKRVK